MKKERIKGVPRKLRDEWRNLMNNSNEKKLSTGAQEIFESSRTVAHKEQWRGVNKAKRKAK